MHGCFCKVSVSPIYYAIFVSIIIKRTFTAHLKCSKFDVYLYLLKKGVFGQFFHIYFVYNHIENYTFGLQNLIKKTDFQKCITF